MIKKRDEPLVLNVIVYFGTCRLERKTPVGVRGWSGNQQPTYKNEKGRNQSVPSF
ncbi:MULTISPECIES: hypothetical protein [unclassified Bacillus (in: firmicutes)]|uniref:hypothetical protein n=1 Tax=unclassified Bacillus (in: firmicutes) TaxID=185979 RepID=UPI001596AD4F|nr:MULTISPECIES: hypothetical protein [unclassified Bacillus (in: firmicutes)]